MGDERGTPGFFRMMRSVVAAPYYRRVAAQERALYDAEAARHAREMLGEAVRMVRPETDGFVPVTFGDKRGLDAQDTRTLRQQALKAQYSSPLLGGYLRMLKRFVIGKGPTISPVVDEETAEGKKLKAEIERWFRMFRKVNRWDDLEDEIPERTWRDGEVFIRHFVQDVEGPLDSKVKTAVATRLARLGTPAADLKGPIVPKGMTILRLIDPEQIADSESVIEHGIVTTRDDAQTVLGYIWQRDPTEAKKDEFVPAEEMIHRKINVDSDVLRGRSIFEPLLRRDAQYEEWFRYRMALSKARSAIAWIKRVEGGTPAQGRALRDEQESQREDETNDRRLRMPKEATTIQHGPGISYKFETPNLQAQDAQHDGRAIQLNMAAGAGMPEYLFTGDSSNANYASTLVAEGPAYREFESWQDYFGPTYAEIFRWVLVDAAKVGAIPGLSELQAEELTLHIKWPAIEVRDEEDHTKANRMRYDGGILSREGWAEDEGIDHALERDRIARERDEDLEWLPPELGGTEGGKRVA